MTKYQKFKATFDEALEAEYAQWLKRTRKRNMRRITLRVNNGDNQCLPPFAWAALFSRLAA